ncbi:thiol reductant ABC exporter subunit CydD [Evansella cellulosilytica]|uniref:ABC transporter, CydDC cysteine exporter (CydDC-E) family, permease/ATP-binding protein CydD n=1 Tax=Evansella cellulosilytica (strain ATCC 21833 / DSM 2522 / FERM P-1141 / JCM 9156 / N-4) TaxID=649639 RepID=E6TU78_EVAC2|nr:thiol reductant ABC exporter subunit CydD [Evansella cellulosilytica]ADU28538.1 ABC transporter, CydDC cysteine exporter (CydDC-E) family, permease/ATP-binding protein CydD [Evansella cellulosilytica DSM 2522]
MKQLKEIARSQKKEMYVLLCLSILIGLVIVGQAYFIVEIVDRVFLQGETFQAVLPFLGGLVLVLIARAIFSYANGRTGISMAAKVKKDYRRALLKKYSTNPIQASLKGQSGQKVSVLLDSVDEIDSYFSKYYPQMIQTSIVPLIILIAIFSQNWVSGLIMVVTAPFIPIFMIVIGSATQKKSEQQMDKLAAFSGRFLDILQGLTTLKLFGRAKKQRDVIQQSSLDYREATMTVLKTAFLSSLALEFISMLSIALVALEVGLRLVIYGHLTFFTAFFVLILVPEFFNSLKELGSAFHTGRGSMGAANKIHEELEEKEQPVIWGSKALDKKPVTIELRHASFRYGESGFSLENIDATINPLSEVAIVGRSGSGKTTLLHLLSGIIPTTEGDVFVNGNKLFDYKETDWFDELSYISQNPYLFSGTIAENIAIGGKKDATRQEIIAAAEKAGIAEMIEDLSEGYDTKIGEAGRGLSGGEKQRVALARAFLKKPSIVLFDEPTVGLDLQTERILQRSIKELSETATIITVAHRLHTIKNADQILFLSDGQLLGKGTHEELLASVEEYRHMVAAQQGGNAG